LLVDPVKVEITPASSTVDRIEQSVYLVDKANKQKLLHHILQDRSIESALVFTRTKHGADRVVRELTKANIRAQAIHGNKSQNARQNALNQFKNGSTRVLVATDIAARGIDIEELPYVINFNLPNIPETYVHRIGRTGRAGLSGIAISFCEEEELPFLRDIEKLIRKSIPVVKDHPYPMVGAAAEDEPAGKGKAKAPSIVVHPTKAPANKQSRPKGEAVGQPNSRPSGRPRTSEGNRQVARQAEPTGQPMAERRSQSSTAPFKQQKSTAASPTQPAHKPKSWWMTPGERK
jgi:ATP-dependent RNA helicase RhlE